MSVPMIEPCTLQHASAEGMSGVVGRLMDGHMYFYEPLAQYLHRLDSTEGLTLGPAVSPQAVPVVLGSMRRAYAQQQS